MVVDLKEAQMKIVKMVYQTQRFLNRMWGPGEICAQWIVFVYLVKKKKKTVYGIIFGLASSVAGSQVHFSHCASFWEFPDRSRKPRSRAAMIHSMKEWKDKVKWGGRDRQMKTGEYGL